MFFRSIPAVLAAQAGLLLAIGYQAIQKDDWNYSPVAAAWTTTFVWLILFLDACIHAENVKQGVTITAFIVAVCLGAGTYIGFPQAALLGWGLILAANPAYALFSRHVMPRFPLSIQRPYFRYIWLPKNVKTGKEHLPPPAFAAFEEAVKDGLLEDAFNKGGLAQVRATLKEWVENRAKEDFDEDDHPLAAMMAAMGKHVHVHKVDMSNFQGGDGDKFAKFVLDQAQIDKDFKKPSAN